MSKLEDIEAERKARKEALQEKADAQRVIDLEALNAAEIEHGDTSVCHIDVPYTPGLPTLVVGRVPGSAELKRYRAGMKVVPGEKLDLGATNEAAATLGGAVCIYPEKDVFAKMCEARPDLKSQLGTRASKLAQGKAADEGKE